MMKKAVFLLVFLSVSFMLFPLYSLSIDRYRVVKLENGLKVVIIPQEDEFLSTVQLWVNSGSTCDSYFERGISSLTARVIVSELNEDDGGYSFRVGKDWVYFNHLALSEEVEGILNRYGSILSNIDIGEDTLRRSKNDLVRDLILRKLDASSLMKKMEFETLFLNFPYRYPTDGYVGTVERIGREGIENFILKHYTADRMVLLIIGDVNMDKIEDICKNSLLLKIRSSKMKSTNFQIIEPPLLEIRDRGMRANLEETLTSISWWYPMNDENFYISLILSELLKGSSNISLSLKVKRELKLANNLEIGVENYAMAGYISIRSKMNSRNEYKVKETILRIITDISLGKLEKDELEYAKKRVYSHIIFGLDSLEKRAELLGMCIMERKRTLLELRKGINSITLKDIQNFTKRYLSRKSYVYTYIVPEYRPVSRKRRR
jgi:zinc protease